MRYFRRFAFNIGRFFVFGLKFQVIQIEFSGKLHVGFENALHQVGRIVVGFFAVRRNSIARHEQLKVVHERVAGGEQNTDVARDATYYQGFGAQIIEQNVEIGREKATVFGLQNEVIVVVRLQQFDDFAASHIAFQAMLHQRTRVGAPLSEVVVDINRWYVSVCGAFF